MLCLVGDVGGVVKLSISVAIFLLRLGGERGMDSESERFLLRRGMGGGAVIAFCRDANLWKPKSGRFFPFWREF